jgi:Bardet-Biedl syndrome 9 protein
MSVFQLQEWWSVKVAEDEEFDLNCFDIGNVDNSVTLTNKVVVGSLKGVLRMYNPNRPNYRVEDMVMEENLEKPILQLSVGRFIPGSEILGLAILHPRELVVYEVIPQG